MDEDGAFDAVEVCDAEGNVGVIPDGCQEEVVAVGEVNVP